MSPDLLIDPHLVVAVIFPVWGREEGGLKILLRRFDQPGPGPRFQLWNFSGAKPRPAIDPTPTSTDFLDDTPIWGRVSSTVGGRWLVTDFVRTPQYRLTRVGPKGWEPATEKFGEWTETWGHLSPEGTLAINITNADNTKRPPVLEGWDVAAQPPKKKWSIDVPQYPGVNGDHSPDIWIAADKSRFLTHTRAKVVDPHQLVVWNNTGEQPAVWATIPIAPHSYRAALSPDGKTLCHTKLAPGQIVIEDLSGAQPREVGTFTEDLLDRGIFWLSFHPDNRHLLYSSTAGLGVIDLTTRKQVWKWTTAPGAIHWAEFSHDGRHIVTLNGNKTVYVFRLSDGFAPAVPVETKAKGDAIDFPAERKAAEAYLALRSLKKGTFHNFGIHLSDATGTVIGSAEDDKLPETPFYISHLSIQQSDFTDGDLAFLKNCSRLVSVDLHENPRLTAQMLTGLNVKHLRTLRLRAPTNMGDEIAETLARAASLEWIDLTGTKITADGAASLRHCLRLRVLQMPGSAVNDKVCALLAANCRELRTFLAEGGWAANPKALVGLPRLRELRITGECLKKDDANENVAALASMPFLDTLHVDSPMNDEWLAKLKPLAGQIRRLQVMSWAEWDPGITASGWRVLNSFQNLEDLEIGGVKSALDGPALLKLAELPALRKLQFRFDDPANRKYTPADVAQFRQRRPDVELVINEGKGFQTMPRLDLYPRAEDGKSLALWDLPKDAPKPAIAPFSPEAAKKHQDAWAAYRKMPVDETSKASGMKFRFIPPGEQVVILADERRELVRLTTPFYLGVAEVTVGQFKKFLDATGYKTEAERGLGVQDQGRTDLTWKSPGYLIADNLPITALTDNDLSEFLAWLSREDGVVYRLPTEGEWEWAARAGGPLWDPESPAAKDPKESPFTPGATSPLPVGSKRPNSFGLSEMLGNVWEVCWSGQQSPKNGQGTSTMLRGASFGNANPTLSHSENARIRGHVGFRVLRQTTNDPPPNPFKLSEKPLMVGKGEPLSPQAAVSRPAAIAGVRSWAVRPAGNPTYTGMQGAVWSPKGNVIATGHYESVCLWDRKGNLKNVLHVDTSLVDRCSFSADGGLIAAVESDTLRVFDVESGSLRFVHHHAGASMREPAFASRNAKDHRIAIASHAGLKIIDLDSGSVVIGIQANANHCVAWSPDGESLLTGNLSGDLVIWNSRTGAKIGELSATDGLVGHVERVAWSPDGQRVAVANHNDGKLRIWDAKSRKHEKTIAPPPGGGGVVAMAWLPDGRRLVVSWHDASLLSLVDVFDGKVTDRLGECHHFAVSPDGSEVFAARTQRPQVLEIPSGKILHEGPLWNMGGSIVRFATGELRLSSGERNRTRRFDLETGDRLADEAWQRVEGDVHFRDTCANGMREVYTGKERVIVAAKDRPPLTIKLPFDPTDAKFDSSGTRLAVVFGTTAMTYDPATGNKLSEMSHPGPVITFQFSPDGSRLATACEDKTIRVWDAANGKQIANTTLAKLRLFRDFPLAWEPDGAALWTRLENHAVRIDARTGEILSSADIGGGEGIRSLSLAPDGDTLFAQNDGHWAFVRPADASPRKIGYDFADSWGSSPHIRWLADARRFVGASAAVARGFDTRRNQRLGVLYPALTGDHWLTVGPDGYYRGSQGVEERIVYVAMLDDGSQRTFTPADFEKRFGWKNDPSKARFLGLSSPP